MIGQKKVLIVLDDVNDSEQLEELFGTPDWYGLGSRIIITTRDIKVLIANKVPEIYHVGGLSSCEAFQLFKLNAFNQGDLEMEFYELSKRVVDYAKGIPLVLKILAHLLCGKDKEVWKSQLEKLKGIKSNNVHDFVKLSFDDLHHEEQEILLDLACFCRRANMTENFNMKVDSINILLGDCGSHNAVVVGLERLKEKSLITISEDNVVSMHDTIQEMAWEIVCQESNDLGNRSRLWDPIEIYDVSKNDKGTKAIRSITTPLSTLKNLKLRPDAFVRMSNLQFLDFGNNSPSLPQGLQSLPNELRYLHWMHYPLTCLPEQFSAEKLVILDLSCSRVEKLWHEVKNLVNLKNVKFRWCVLLNELPDFSKSTNLKVLDVSCSSGLTSVHPSIFSLHKLEKLDLSGCSSLIKFSSDDGHLSSLLYLNLSDCEELREFSVTAENVVELDLTGILISSLPLSFGSLRKLEMLHLIRSDIESLPTCINNLTRLRYLDLSCCSNLCILPKLPPSLETLHADECESLETVLFPSTAVEQFEENRKRVEFWNCLKLDEFSLMAIELNAQINVMKFAYQHLSAPILDHVENYNDYKDLHDSYQAVYMYPGSNVPEWLAYKTRKDYVIIDLSSAPPAHLGFIFCFILDKDTEEFLDPALQFSISISNGENECKRDSVEIQTSGPYSMIYSDHVCVLYDKRCSCYLNNRLKSLAKFKIKVSWLTDGERWEALKGFGVSPINTSVYHNFVQQMELCDQGFRPVLKRTPKKRKR
ncbi:Putative disease resistance protein [Glycine soja]|nr:Putative disease resistance protein [Glycine soja]